MAQRVALCRSLLALTMIAGSSAASAQPRLINRVVTYTAEDGSSKTIDVGRECVDLWVAPDESVIAFVAVEKADGTDESGGPFILVSSIYMARKADNFRPVKVPIGIVRDNAQGIWEVFREPSVSPDGRTIFFYVPAAATGGFLVAHSLKTQANEMIGDATDYCNVWSGRRAGSVLVQRRYLVPVQDVIGYQCYVKRPAGKEAAAEGAACQEFSKTYLKGAACSPPPR